MKNWIEKHYNIFCVIIILLIFFIALFVSFFYNLITSYNTQKSFSQKNPQWGGYAPTNLYKVFDKETGVYYIITESGDIEVLVDKNGNPYRVDGEG